MKEKLWGGRFSLSTDKLAEEFNASIHFDKHLYPYDINGSIAHAEMLSIKGIIEKTEFEAIKEGLIKIKEEMDAGAFVFRTEDEDIHMAVEKRLREAYRGCCRKTAYRKKQKRSGSNRYKTLSKGPYRYN